MTVNMQQYTLVVGGNRGIGLEVVRKLVDVGKPVILTSRDPASGECTCGIEHTKLVSTASCACYAMHAP